MEIEFKDIKPGDIFTIENTPSYPKLRTTTGYVDMRDLIVKDINNMNWATRIMTKEEVAQNFEGTVEEVKGWIKDVIRTTGKSILE